MALSFALVLLLALTLPLGGCGGAQITYVSPWLREVSRKDTSFDSGGRVHVALERRDAGGWRRLPRANHAVALAGDRAAVRTDDGRIAIASADGGWEELPSCASRAAVVSPDRRRVVCFERGFQPLGFEGDVLHAVGETADTPNERRCRLVSIDAQGRATITKESVVHYPPDDCWGTFRASAIESAHLVTAVPGP